MIESEGTVEPTPTPTSTKSSNVQTATPSPSPTPTEQITTPPQKEGIVMKPGDKYRIFIWSSTYQNQPVADTGIGRSGETWQRWTDFQKEYNVTVTWVANPDPVNWMNYVLNTAAVGEPLADIFHMGGPFVIPHAMSYANLTYGYLFDDLSRYDQYTNFDDETRWDQHAQSSMGTYDGKLYSVFPYGDGWANVSTNQVTFFNKDILQDAGYSANEIYGLYKSGDWTFDRFREIAMACTNPDKNVYGTAICQNGMALLSLIAANGGEIITKADNSAPKFAANSANAITAAEFFVDLCVKDGAVITDNGPSQIEADLFKKGNIAMMLTYANRVIEGEETRTSIYQDKSLSYGIVLPPKGPNASDYISDKNWAAPIAVFKGHSNPAGVAQCVDLYLSPSHPLNSAEQEAMLMEDATTYFRDIESIITLKDAVDKTVTTSYMAYWSVTSDDLSLSTVVAYNIPTWIDGSSTSALDFARYESSLNALLANAVS